MAENIHPERFNPILWIAQQIQVVVTIDERNDARQ